MNAVNWIWLVSSSGGRLPFWSSAGCVVVRSASAFPLFLAFLVFLLDPHHLRPCMQVTAIDRWALKSDKWTPRRGKDVIHCCGSGRDDEMSAVNTSDPSSRHAEWRMWQASRQAPTFRMNASRQIRWSLKHDRDRLLSSGHVDVCSIRWGCLVATWADTCRYRLPDDGV